MNIFVIQNLLMNFTTTFQIKKCNYPVDYYSKIVLLGSCFSENIGSKFDYYKFQATSNPFGIIFNPVSIEKILSRSINLEYFTENDIFCHNERWHCYEVHSEVSNENKVVFLETLNAKLDVTNNQISQSTHLIITYGTSWVYRLKTTGAVVANCHKVAQSEFDKEILSVDVVEQSLKNILDLIQTINSQCQVMLTVSPVRHIKDGFVENQQSKAHLIAAIHKIMNNELGILNYFPSYEIMMDELRDYRYYAPDMLHLSEVAVDYIWERFCESAIAEGSYGTMDAVGTIQKGLAHCPFNVASERHQQFLAGLQQKIMKLQKEFSFMEF